MLTISCPCFFKYATQQSVMLIPLKKKYKNHSIAFRKLQIKNVQIAIYAILVRTRLDEHFSDYTLNIFLA